MALKRVKEASPREVLRSVAERTRNLRLARAAGSVGEGRERGDAPRSLVLVRPCSLGTALVSGAARLNGKIVLKGKR